MKKIVVIAAVLALGVGGYFFWRTHSQDDQAVAKVVTAKVERGPIRSAVASTGKVEANLDVDIKCKASGQIMELPFDVSAVVKKDDLLVKLDPIDEERVLKKAEVTLAASQAKLRIAEENLAVAEMTLVSDTRKAKSALLSAEIREKDGHSKADRMKQLLEKKLASQEEYDTVLALAAQLQTELDNARVKMDELKTQERALELRRQEVKLAKAQVDADQISLTISQDRVRDTKVMAPMDGVVAVRNVQIGQIISSAVSNVGGGTTVLTLSDLSRVFVVASVDESDIGRVVLDQEAKITVDAYPGRKFKGKVVQIATRGVNISNVVTFEVKIEVVSEDKNLLKPEMTANVEIIVKEVRDVLCVPVEAVSRKGGKQLATVVAPDQSTRECEVKTGISDGNKIEIVAGLSEGENVIVRKGGSEGRWSSSGGSSRPPPMMGAGGGGGRR